MPRPYDITLAIECCNQGVTLLCRSGKADCAILILHIRDKSVATLALNSRNPQPIGLGDVVDSGVIHLASLEGVVALHVNHIAVRVAEFAEVVAIALRTLPLNLLQGCNLVALNSDTCKFCREGLSVGINQREGKALLVVVGRQHEAEYRSVLDIYTRSATINNYILRCIRIQRQAGCRGR